MNHATPIEAHKAAKQHRCDWCWQFVEPGETYKRYRCYQDGDTCTVKMHPECCEAMQDEASAEGGWFEWTPGQERPAPKPKSPAAICAKCGVNMLPGKAMESTFVGHPDFPGQTGNEVGCTLSQGGLGRLVDCLKCPLCGHSVTGGTP